MPEWADWCRRSLEFIIGEIRKWRWWETYFRSIMKAYAYNICCLFCYVVSQKQFWYDLRLALKENKEQIMLLASEFEELTYDDNKEADNWCIVSGRLLKRICLSVQRNGHQGKDKVSWTHFIFPYVPLVLNCTYCPLIGPVTRRSPEIQILGGR